MSVDERTRHEMYLGLEEKLGTTVADALMQHLPPVGWADVATKHDLAREFARLEEHIDARIQAESIRLVLFMFPTMLTGLAIAALLGKLA